MNTIVPAPNGVFTSNYFTETNIMNTIKKIMVVAG